jgi:glycosyltransferase involved in cell wall biosynthesis
VRNIPTVLDHHNIESHMLLRRADNEANVLKKWYFRQEGRRLQSLENIICPQFTLNITCSDIDSDRLKDIAKDIHVDEVPNGVDIGYFKPENTVQLNNSLIFVGTLSWYPNVEAVRFIGHKLWPALKSAIPDITIDVVGANPPDDIKQIGEIDEDFHVHGFVDDVRPYLSRSSVYICPIKDGGGTKLKILDALAMEKAVVAHPIACEGIQVENGLNVIFAETIEDYVHSIKSLLDNNRQRLSIGKAARELIEDKYTYEKVGKKLSDLYEDCAKRFQSKRQ